MVSCSLVVAGVGLPYSNVAVLKPGLADQEAGTKNWRFRGSKSPNLFTVVLNSLIYKDSVPKRSHKDKILSTKSIGTILLKNKIL
jgi:hypothetical protein